MKFCIAVGIGDLITHANFGDHRSTRFQIAGVKFQAFPLTFSVVLITHWHYKKMQTHFNYL